jgi:hypothetical protein
MQGDFPLLHLRNGFFEPVAGKGIKGLSDNFAILGNSFVDVEAFVAHGPTAGLGGSERLSVIDMAREDDR